MTDKWWLCPYDPPCGHGRIVHDGDGYDEPYMCCVEGCTCPAPADVTALLTRLEEARAGGAENWKAPHDNARPSRLDVRSTCEHCVLPWPHEPHPAAEEATE